MSSSTTSGRVVVLAGGLSPERDVSVRSGRRVAEALRLTGLTVDVLDADAGLLASLAADRPSCVVPLLHGAPGEDGAVRGVLDALGLPYVGSTPEVCRTSFDKPVASARVRAAGIAVPAQFVLAATTFRELGASVVRSAADLPGAMMASFAYGETALIERFITGTEVAVSVVDDGSGPRALPVVEIVPDGGFYDYGARYTAGATEFFVPARLSDDVLAACAATATTVHSTLGLRHWSRVDLIVDADGTPWFLEVNVAPGMTETSTYPQAVAAAGLDLGALVATLVARATEA